jgi:hypothetical protein
VALGSDWQFGDINGLVVPMPWMRKTVPRSMLAVSRSKVAAASAIADSAILIFALLLVALLSIVGEWVDG